MSIRQVVVSLCAGDERLDIFDSFVQFAQKTQMDYENVLMNAYYNNDHLPYNEQLQVIFNECSKALYFALENAGITANPEVSLKDLIVINNAIISSLEYEDKVSINDILLSDEDDLDKLCSIFSLATVKDESYFNSVLDSVTASTIKLYKDICASSEGVATEEELKAIRAKVDMYRYYKQKINNEELLSDMALSAVGGIGQPMQSYMYAFAQRVDFYEQNIEIFVKDYYGFALLSAEGVVDFLNSLDAAAKALYFKPDSQTKVAVYARTFMGVVA